MKTNLIISVAIPADNLVFMPSPAIGTEVYQGDYGVKQAKIRIQYEKYNQHNTASNRLPKLRTLKVYVRHL